MVKPGGKKTSPEREIFLISLKNCPAYSAEVRIGQKKYINIYLEFENQPGNHIWTEQYTGMTVINEQY